MIKVVCWILKCIELLVWTAFVAIVGVFGGFILVAWEIEEGVLDKTMFDALVEHKYLRKNRSGAWVRC